MTSAICTEFQSRTKSEQNETLFAFDRYRGNLDACAIYQCCDLDGCARWLRIGHHAFVNLVHVGELVDICQKYGHADHVFQLKSGFLQHPLNILEGSAGLWTDAASGQFVGSIGTLLSGNVKSVAGNDSIAERKPSRGR